MRYKTFAKINFNHLPKNVSSVYFQVYFAGCADWCVARGYISKFLFINTLENKLSAQKPG